MGIIESGIEFITQAAQELERQLTENERIEEKMKKNNEVRQIKITTTTCCKSLEEKVRELAYFKWEAAGKPLSDGSEFWLAAEEEIFGPKEGLLDLEKTAV